MTIKELEQIEDRARRGLPIDSVHILSLTGYLRNVLQEKANAEAVAVEALKKAGMKSRYYTAELAAQHDDQGERKRWPLVFSLYFGALRSTLHVKSCWPVAKSTTWRSPQVELEELGEFPKSVHITPQLRVFHC